MCADRPLTAEQIVNDLIREAEPGYFPEHLHQLFISFVGSPDSDDQELRGEVSYVYQCLRGHLIRIDQLHLERRAS